MFAADAELTHSAVTAGARIALGRELASVNKNRTTQVVDPGTISQLCKPEARLAAFRADAGRDARRRRAQPRLQGGLAASLGRRRAPPASPSFGRCLESLEGTRARTLTRAAGRPAPSAAGRRERKRRKKPTPAPRCRTGGSRWRPPAGCTSAPPSRKKGSKRVSGSSAPRRGDRGRAAARWRGARREARRTRRRSSARRWPR